MVLPVVMGVEFRVGSEVAVLTAVEVGLAAVGDTPIRQPSTAQPESAMQEASAAAIASRALNSAASQRITGAATANESAMRSTKLWTHDVLVGEAAAECQVLLLEQLGLRMIGREARWDALQLVARDRPKVDTKRFSSISRCTAAGSSTSAARKAASLVVGGCHMPPPI